MNLVIVESPAKARTIEGYLGKGYKVIASYGHIRDLPKSKLGVNTDTFDPEYVTPTKVRKNVTALKKQAEKATKIILATDEDREGEAIAWHVANTIGVPEAKCDRITFHEITKDAILDAVAHPRCVNMNLVNAQQARRVLDRLVGYNLSPLLWKKVRRGLSAGRVQSVALKLIVDREREILAHKPEEYWEIDATFNKSKEKDHEFEAHLTKKGGKNIEIKSQKETDQILADLKDQKFTVAKVENKELKKKPYAPFITSSLQMEAARKLHYSSKKTMMLAQRLYEGVECVPGEGCTGLITYMRTDSTNLSDQAIGQARDYIKKEFGDKYLPEKPRIYKKAKAAQEAHEAIRPTDINRTPESLKGIISADEMKVYELIWKRTVASQMTEEILALTGADIKGADYIFRANGKRVAFDGFTRVYLEGTSEKIAEESKEVKLPELVEGDECDLKEIKPEQKFTKPPARYSEASLIKTLEEYGIGRPSTYAPTISTIKDRGYVRLENRYFIPEEVGFVVNDGLVKYFPDLVNVDFTAEMENELDEVAEGKEDWKRPIREFWPAFEMNVAKAQDDWVKIDMDEKTDEVCEKCGKPMIIKVGRFGKFMACTGFPDCKNTKPVKQITGQKCPECKEGDVVIKKTKRGKTFWGCSRYPDCNWASWQPPKSDDDSN